MVSRMIKQDPFECPTLTEVINFSRRKSKEYEPNPNSNPTVEFDIEKIQLTDKYRGEMMKKFARPCCKTVENEEVDVDLEKKGNLTMAYVRRDVSKHTHHHRHHRTSTQVQLDKFSGNRSFLPEISPIRSHRYKLK